MAKKGGGLAAPEHASFTIRAVSYIQKKLCQSHSKALF